MSEHFRESQAPQFSSSVETACRASSADPATIEVRAGAAIARMRLAGGFITHLSLGEPVMHNRVPIFHAGTDLSVPKLVASHGMMPVGLYDGAGGQHGISRWLNYRVKEASNADPRGGFAHTTADTLDLGMTVERNLSLNPTQFSVVNCIRNNTSEPVRTSFGEHLYFALPDGAEVSDLRLNNGSVDELLGRGAAGRIANGEAQFWGDFPGEIDVELPNDHKLNISAGPDGHRREDFVHMGMLMWQRPGEQYVCLEPTYGFEMSDDGLINDGITVPAHGGAAALDTLVSLYY